MQRLAVVLIVTLFAGGSAQAAGRFAKLLSRNEMEHGPLRSRPTGVKLLELELVKSPGVRQIVDEFATLQFRVRQLNNPDPQYVPPPIRLRRYSLSGAQLEQAWLHPNGEGDLRNVCADARSPAALFLFRNRFQPDDSQEGAVGGAEVCPALAVP